MKKGPVCYIYYSIKNKRQSKRENSSLNKSDQYLAMESIQENQIDKN